MFLLSCILTYGEWKHVLSPGEVQDLSEVREKVGCLAKYSEDDTWYRAVVEEKTFDSAKVLFVDYGNQENVAFDKIKVSA